MTPNKRPEDPASVRKVVSERYGRIAERSASCCGPSASDCGSAPGADQVAGRIGYSTKQLEALPEGANLGLGCGNPTAIDSLKPGEVVVDLGSGAGIDAFLAAKQVGPTGKVIGIDMTDAMLDKARRNASAGGYENVEFRKGRIEELPLEDESVDVIISNCVINLSPEKDKVYREAHRVLKPGGRMMISDIVLEKELPREVKDNIDAWVGCIGGASLRSDYLQTIKDAGFSEIRVDREAKFGDAVSLSDPSVRSLSSDYGVPLDKVSDVLEAITSLNLLVRK
ncbi:MAG: arsenite methyltransferase [Acidobacteriota bacterium]